VDSAVATGNRDIIISSIADALNFIKPTTEELQLLSYENTTNASYAAAKKGLFNARERVNQIRELAEKHLATTEKGSTQKVDKKLSIALSFASGIANQAIWNFSDDGGDNPFSLDSHSQHERRHMANQQAVWEKVAETFKLFKSIEFNRSTLFDHTTFMVVTEFSRTPFLNGAKGKDHNPLTNSVLLAGKNIRGNTVLGGSHMIPRKIAASGIAQHISSPISYTDGQIIRSSQAATKDVGLIYPENIARTIAKVFGDPPKFSSTPMSTRVLPGIVKV
jgi:uncharacterized protein (DUF1501 family)